MSFVEARGTSGGIAFLWNDYYHIQILDSSMNWIHTCMMERRSGHVFEMTFVYGNPTFQERRLLWNKILALQPNNQNPWCCMGDFNEMLANHENDGIIPIEAGRINLFRDFLNRYELVDMELKDCKFTWMSNPREGVTTRQKIDRILANWSWMNLFPHALALALPIVN